MLIYYWFLFVVVCIFIFVPLFVYLGILSDDGYRAGKSSYLPMLTVVFSGLVPIVGSLVLAQETLSVIWKCILGITILVCFFPCIRFTRRNKHFLYGFLCVVLLSILPFIKYSNINISPNVNITQLFGFQNIEYTLLICVLGLMSGGLIGYIIIQRRKRMQFERFLYSNDIFDSEAIRNLSNIIERNNMLLSGQIKNLSNLVERLQLQTLVSKYPSGENKLDPRIGQVLTRLTEDVAILKKHACQYQVGEINIDQEVLVREITHFIATPLATIDASCKMLRSIPLKGKEHAKLNENFERIISAVGMCNGILATYREIFAGGKIDETQKLSKLVNASFGVYQNMAGKQLKLNLQVNDTHPDLSNYYILSMILPLLSNAVTAAKSSSTIEVIETDGIIRISNTFKEKVDISNFEKDGYSSKEGGNHRGMGLFTVRHLLARRKLGGMNYYQRDNRIYFEIPIIVKDEK